MPEENPVPQQTAPWYESNLLWCPLSLAGGIILTVVAAVKHDLRWLLWFAWPFFAIAIWWLARRTREVWIITILGVFVAGGVLFSLSKWLGGSQETAEVPAQTVLTTTNPQSQAATQTPTPPTALTERLTNKPLPVRKAPSPTSTPAPSTPIPLAGAPLSVSAAPTPMYAPICPNGICPTAPNFGTQTVTNNGPPPPQIVGLYKEKLEPIPSFNAAQNDPNRESLRQKWIQSLGAESHSGQRVTLTENPGLKVSFQVSQPFADPDFDISCAHCAVTGILYVRGGPNYSMATPNRPEVLTRETTVVIYTRSTLASTPVDDVIPTIDMHSTP